MFSFFPKSPSKIEIEWPDEPAYMYMSAARLPPRTPWDDLIGWAENAIFSLLGLEEERGLHCSGIDDVYRYKRGDEYVFLTKNWHFNPSEDDQHASFLIKEMAERGYRYSLVKRDNLWVVNFTDNPLEAQDSPNYGEALTLAAAFALGWEGPVWDEYWAFNYDLKEIAEWGRP